MRFEKLSSGTAGRVTLLCGDASRGLKNGKSGASDLGLVECTIQFQTVPSLSPLIIKVISGCLPSFA